MPGGGGGMPGGMPGGGFSFSSNDANDIFSQFFGGQDPFSVFAGGGGMGGGGGGGPGMNFQMGGMPGGGGGGGMGGMGGGMGGGGIDLQSLFGGMGGMPGGMGGMGGPGGMGRQPAAPARFDQLPQGARVMICGLIGAAHRNGELGKIAGFDAAKQRYTVQLEDDEALSCKPDNLLQLAKGVEVVGVVKQPQLNGAKGTVINYDAEKGSYWVRLASPAKTIALKPINVRLPNSSRVKIVGLKSQPQMNGKWGQIKNFDVESGRYFVQVDASGKQLKLKRDNVVL
jgi:hypothetical protein